MAGKLIFYTLLFTLPIRNQDKGRWTRGTSREAWAEVCRRGIESNPQILFKTAKLPNSLPCFPTLIRFVAYRIIISNFSNEHHSQYRYFGKTLLVLQIDSPGHHRLSHSLKSFHSKMTSCSTQVNRSGLALKPPVAQFDSILATTSH